MKRMIKATKATILEASKRLRLSPKELLILQTSTTEKKFCACCLHLERDQSDTNQLRLDLKPQVKLLISGPEIYDSRYSLLFFLIAEFYYQDPLTFFTRTPVASVVPEQIKISSVPSGALFNNPEYSPALVCAECSRPVYFTSSGWVCAEGHGGSTVAKESRTDSLTAKERFFASLKNRPTIETAEGSYLESMPAAVEVSDAEEKRLIEMFGSKAEKRVIEYNKEPDVPWNSEQQQAFKGVFKWLKGYNNLVYRLFGFAGTGKTTMARKVAVFAENELGSHVVFAAYTGKAASVLKSKGCANTSTVHSLIYRPKIDHDTGKIIGQELNLESPLRNACLLILDEASMVDIQMAKDLLSFGIPILVLGDPGQIPPPKGVGYFTQAPPDFMLTDIERQARDNPIIWLATRARLGKIIKPGHYGDSLVLSPNAELTDEMIRAADQMICGTNRTRQSLNVRYRGLNGKFEKDSQYPVKGDRLICLRNNKDNGLLNGTIWTCTNPTIEPMLQPIDHKNLSKGFRQLNLEGLHFKVRAHDIFLANGDPLIVSTVCSVHLFDRNLPEPHWRDVAHCDEFDFAYCITGHKSQGSQYDNLLVYDESQVFREHEDKHRYTCITRAVDRVTIKQTKDY